MTTKQGEDIMISVSKYAKKSDIRKARLLVIAYNQGSLRADQLIDQVGAIFDLSWAGSIAIISGFSVYEGTFDQLWDNYNTCKNQQ